MNLQKQLEYNNGLSIYRVLSNEAPGYISNLYTHTPSRYSNSRNYHLSLLRPRIDIVQELCESRGGRPGLSVLTSLLVSVDVKIY